MLLKLAIAAVAGYIFWGVVRKVLGNLLGGGQATQERSPVKAPPAAPARTIEDTRQCTVCGAYVSLSAAKCSRPDCPQPA